MARRSVRSISVPIVLASVAVPLSIALLVGWTLLTVQNLTLEREVAQNVWLLVLGAISFMFIMAVLITFSVFLVREILEVRRQNSFIDSVTHELKSPLASIKLVLETLGRESVTAEQREQLRAMALDDVDRLSSFIDDVLQASRLAHDRTGMSLSDVAVRDLLVRCADTVASRHKLPPDRVRVDVPGTLVVRTDATALEIVMKNLIDNAVKYSDGEPHVEVLAVADARATVIEVRDRGIGIPKKALKRVFHRFYRVSDENVRARRGTGLGLFVVSALVRNLGGSVEARSPGPNGGTTMRVVLPTVPKGTAMPKTSEARA